MEERLTSEIRELIDRHQIRECLVRYARGIDRYDVGLVRSAFHPDAVDSHGPATVTIDEFVAQLMPGLKDREASQHFLMNHYAEIDGDTAHTETYFIVVRKFAGSDQAELMGGRYVDRFERRNGEWRIARRLLVVDWQVNADASRMSEALAIHHRGSLGDRDPSYERPLQSRPPAGSQS